MTKVIFKILEDEVIALFPELPGDMNPYRTCLSYMHIGQHSAADIRLSSLKPAKESDYISLLGELKSLGYGDLKIAKRFTQKDLRLRCVNSFVVDGRIK